MKQKNKIFTCAGQDISDDQGLAQGLHDKSHDNGDEQDKADAEENAGGHNLRNSCQPIRLELYFEFG